MKARMIKAVRDQEAGVKVYLRDEEGAKFALYFPQEGYEFMPYFYVLEDESVESELITDSKWDGYVGLDGQKLRRVYTALPSDVPDLRNKFTCHYEADILYPRRFLIDYHIY